MDDVNSEEIETQFNLTKTIISNEECKMSDEMTEKLEIWRSVLALFMFLGGLCIFFKFLPLEIITPETYWLKYFDSCCKFFYNESRCSFSFNCSNMIYKWISMAKKSEEILDKCCYWYAPYPKWRIMSEAFCKLECLRS